MTFDSVYQMTNPLTTVRKQHFWDWFSGDSLNARWSWKAGTGGVVVSEGMNDAIDGGYKLIMTNGHIGTYDFNQKRQYNHNGAVSIGIIQRSGTNGIAGVGLRGDNTVGTSYVDRNSAMIEIRKTTTTIRTRAANSTSITYVNSDTSDDNRHVMKTELNGTDCKHTIDGVLKTTITTTLPDAKMQPFFFAWADGSGAGCHISYIEAYNT